MTEDIKAHRAAQLADIPEDEPVLIVRGSHPAAPETVREFARRVLHHERWAGRASTEETQRDARQLADRAFALADQMEAYQGEQRQARLREEAERARQEADDARRKMLAEMGTKHAG
jgi:hypothetical protein